MAPAGSVTSELAPTKNRILMCIKCSKCNKLVRNGILCDKCDMWIHFRCARLEETCLPDENTPWKCQACEDGGVQIADVSNKPMTIMQNELDSLNTIVTTLKEENCQLLEEVRKLKEHCANSDFELSKRLSAVNYHQIGPNSRPKENQQIGWEEVQKRKSCRPTTNLNLSDFPPLDTANRFKPLCPEIQNLSSNRPRSPRKLPCPNQTKHMPKKDTTTPKPSPPCTLPKKITIYADSQGRSISRILRERSIHHVFGSVKPNAKFDEATDSCHSDSNEDYTVLFAGTNDIARNEKKGLIRALRKRIDVLRNKNVIVVSVPHRHDLPSWSCVNKEVLKANEEMETVCKYFKNAKFLDISKLGKRFHAKKGLHLNGLGKMYVTDKILDIVNETENLVSSKVPIELGFLG